MRLLDTEVIERDGLRIGGVGLIAGNPLKPGRRLEAEQIEHLDLVLSERPDVLVLHEGPSRGDDFPGNPSVTEALAAETPFTICGHVHWPRATAPGDNHVLNVCERVLVLTSAGAVD